MNDFTKDTVDNQRSFAVANNEVMHLDDPDVAFLVENPFDLAENFPSGPENNAIEGKKSVQNLTAS